MQQPVNEHLNITRGKNDKKRDWKTRRRPSVLNNTIANIARAYEDMAGTRQTISQIQMELIQQLVVFVLRLLAAPKYVPPCLWQYCAVRLRLQLFAMWCLLLNDNHRPKPEIIALKRQSIVESRFWYLYDFRYTTVPLP